MADDRSARGAILNAADNMGFGLMVFVDAQVVAANESANLLLDSRSAGLVGKSLMETFVDHTVEELVSTAPADAVASAEIVTGGEPQRTLRIHAWRQGEDETWVGLTDVSELRRLQRIRTEFIDNLSHELRTPLTTIRLLSETLTIEAEREPLPDRVRESMARIDAETEHLAQMVAELLELSTIEQGEVPLAITTVDLSRTVARAVDRVRLYAERQGVELRHEEPPAGMDLSVRADEARIGQLLLNYLHNAIKFSPDGGVVTARMIGQADDVVISVTDEGVGIPSKDLARVFERFYKVDRARARGAGGTGLGLSIARHIAERHGGRVWAESRPGQGSTFFVSLPRTGRPG